MSGESFRCMEAEEPGMVYGRSEKQFSRLNLVGRPGCRAGGGESAAGMGLGAAGLEGRAGGEKHVILDTAGEIIGRDLWASEGAVNLVCEIGCGFGVWGISCGVGLP